MADEEQEQRIREPVSPGDVAASLEEDILEFEKMPTYKLLSDEKGKIEESPAIIGLVKEKILVDQGNFDFISQEESGKTDITNEAPKEYILDEMQSEIIEIEREEVSENQILCNKELENGTSEKMSSLPGITTTPTNQIDKLLPDGNTVREESLDNAYNVNEISDKTSSDRQFPQESSSEINLLRSEGLSLEDTDNEIDENKHPDDEILDKELKATNLPDINNVRNLKEEVVDDIETLSNRQFLQESSSELNFAQSDERFSEIMTTKIHLDDQLSEEELKCTTEETTTGNDISTIETSVKSSTVAEDSNFPGGLENEENMSVIDLRDSRESQNDTPGIVDRHIQDIYDKAKYDRAKPIPSTSKPKKSKWKKFKKFISLGLASSSKPSKETPGVMITKSPQPPSYFSSKDAERPVINTSVPITTKPSMPTQTTSSQNPPRPLYSGSQFKLGLASPKFKSNKDEKDINWLQTFERHLYPLGQQQSDNKEEAQDNKL